MSLYTVTAQLYAGLAYNDTYKIEKKDDSLTETLIHWGSSYAIFLQRYWERCGSARWDKPKEIAYEPFAAASAIRVIATRVTKAL